MKIAKCKCGAEPIFLENGPHDCSHAYCCQQYKAWHVYYCQQCKAWMHWVNDKEEARRLWNAINTDQYGQQLTEQKITWVEWDGDVEHLPEEGTTVFYMAPSEINQKPRGVIGEFVMFDCYPCISFWRCDGVTGAPKQKILIWLKKGDQFAVVGEDSHAS